MLVPEWSGALDVSRTDPEGEHKQFEKNHIITHHLVSIIRTGLSGMRQSRVVAA